MLSSPTEKDIPTPTPTWGAVEKRKGLEIMTIDEAFKTALEYENRVRDIYAEALEKVSDKTGRRILEVLSKEEQGHVDFLNRKFEEWKKSGAVSDEGIGTAVPSPETIEKATKSIEKCMEGGDRSGDLGILEKALQAEIETSEFYRGLVDRLPEEGKKLFSRFLEIEEGHKAIVQAEIDCLTGNGCWFDFNEISLG